MVGVLVHLDEEGVHADGGRRAEERGRFAPVAAALRPEAADPLDAVRPVEDDRVAEAAEDRERAEVDDERPVAERDAALRQEDVAAARAAELLDDVRHLLGREEPTLDGLRGHEGEAARRYFEVFDRLLKREREAFRWSGRSRRPPLDPINALLSFLYALLVHDADAALQSVGLDPGVGFLHADRPGRPSLALDLAEEFRSAIADRLTVSLVNLGQVQPDGFIRAETGSVSMDDATRKAVIVAYQKRKQEPILHPFTGEQGTIGLAIFVQARLLARTIRGDLDAYPPFAMR